MNDMSNRDPTGRLLLSYFERIERLEEEKRSIADDIKDVFTEAKTRGFDTKVMKRVLAERKMDVAERNELNALAEIYRRAIGMDDTPLGDSARRRLASAPPPPQAADEPDASPDAGSEPSSDGQDDLPAMPVIDAAAKEEAREKGKQAARDGQTVLMNPYTADDPRRAYWDEGWCFESGSDGMDIPPAWRRTPRPKKGAE